MSYKTILIWISSNDGKCNHEKHIFRTYYIESAFLRMLESLMIRAPLLISCSVIPVTSSVKWNWSFKKVQPRASMTFHLIEFKAGQKPLE